MKTLVLIRHAKSSWEYDVSDKDRPLAYRGINDANLLSEYFKDFNFKPDAIFSSPANRALSTCNIFIENLNYAKKLLTISNELYDFGGDSVSGFIKKIDDDYENVMIFGHNHAFTSISNIFGDKFIDNLPTCGLVMINFEVDSWKFVDKGHTKLILVPKELK